jgi:hypothetical protein
MDSIDQLEKSAREFREAVRRGEATPPNMEAFRQASQRSIWQRIGQVALRLVILLRFPIVILAGVFWNRADSDVVKPSFLIAAIACFILGGIGFWYSDPERGWKGTK